MKLAGSALQPCLGLVSFESCRSAKEKGLLTHLGCSRSRPHICRLTCLAGLYLCFDSNGLLFSGRIAVSETCLGAAKMIAV